MEKDYLYLSKELLQKLSNIIDWINNNPQVTEVNIYEVTECLIEFGYIEKLYNSIEHFEDKEVCDEINNRIVFLINSLLEKRKDSIAKFTNEMNIKGVFDAFVKEMFNGNCEHDNNYKELICKELGVLFYIYNVKENEKNYQYDNTAEYEMIKRIGDSYGDKLSHELLMKINNYYKFNEVKKESKSTYNKKTCYDQIVFSSREEEKKYIEEKTSEFVIDESLLDKKNNNGIIVITKDSFYAVDPVDIHQMAFQKLFRCINDSDVFLDISEVEDFYVYEGNILIRTVNRGGVIGFDPYIPREITNYQEIQLERLISSLNRVYKDLETYDEDNASNIRYGIDTMKNKGK